MLICIYESILLCFLPLIILFIFYHVFCNITVLFPHLCDNKGIQILILMMHIYLNICIYYGSTALVNYPNQCSVETN